MGRKQNLLPTSTKRCFQILIKNEFSVVKNIVKILYMPTQPLARQKGEDAREFLCRRRKEAAVFKEVVTKEVY